MSAPRLTDRSIYPPEHAAILKVRAGQKYRPSNGSEGDVFYGNWCVDCACEAAHRADPALGDGCLILAASYAFDIDEECYPAEWQYSPAGQPCCTAHTTEGLTERCQLTKDLFGSEMEAS